MGPTETPRYIRNAADFDDVVHPRTTTESIVLDFKQDIGKRHSTDPTVKREAQKEVCRDIAQFANTVGGCVLIGVEEHEDPAKKLNVAKSVKGIPDPDVLKGWITDAVKNFLVPSTLTYDVAAIVLNEGTVLAVNVPPSIYLVAVWDDRCHTIQYVHRTSYGKRYMNPDEMERHLMDGSRAGRLALIEAKNDARSEYVVVSNGVWGATTDTNDEVETRWLPHPPTVRIPNIGDNSFELSIAGSLVAVPYEVLKAAWVDVQSRVNVLLSARLRATANEGIIVEPYEEE